MNTDLTKSDVKNIAKDWIVKALQNGMTLSENDLYTLEENEAIGLEYYKIMKRVEKILGR